MATPSYIESLMSSAKRLRISPPKPNLRRNVNTQRPLPAQSIAKPSTQSQSRRNASQLTSAESTTADLRSLRLPKAVASTFLTPLKRTPTHSLPVADLQLRSYSVRNLELYADFCLRAAYYLNLPARGPVPLPKITERWTVPRSNFVHKKSQENFERVTCRRLIQIQDGNPETVAIWLAYVQKHRYYGIGMKANVWEFGSLDVGAELDGEGAKAKERIGEMAELFGAKRGALPSEEAWEGVLHEEPFKGSWGAGAPLSGSQSTPNVRLPFDRVILGGESVETGGERETGSKRDAKRSTNKSARSDEESA